ncbi:replication initiation protein RepC [Paracoccus mutanolyticus]|nr:replication initiation protein RepC [Paracoccus mutanolyticus]
MPQPQGDHGDVDAGLQQVHPRRLLGRTPKRLLAGAEQAAVVIAFLLERFNEIKSPGGYLRKLRSS